MIAEILQELEQKDVIILLDDNGKIVIDTPDDVLSEDDIIFLKEHKKEIISNLASSGEKRKRLFDGSNELANKFIDYLVRVLSETDSNFMLDAPTIEAHESEQAIIKAIADKSEPDILNALCKEFVWSHTHNDDFNNGKKWIERTGVQLFTIRYFLDGIRQFSKGFDGSFCTDIQGQIIKAVVESQDTKARIEVFIA